MAISVKPEKIVERTVAKKITLTNDQILTIVYEALGIPVGTEPVVDEATGTLTLTWTPAPKPPRAKKPKGDSAV